MRLIEKIFPWAIVGLGVVYCVFAFLPRDEPEDALNVSGFGKIPVLYEGRFMPADTVARVTIMHLTGNRETWNDSEGNTQPAIRFLLDALSGQAAFDRAIEDGLEKRALHVPNEKVREALALPPREGDLYSMNDLKAKVDRLRQFLSRAESVDPESRDSFDSAVVNLSTQVQEHIAQTNANAYNATEAAKHPVFRIDNEEVLSLLGLEPRPRLRYALSEFAGRLKDFYVQAERAQNKARQDRTLYESKLVEVGGRLEAYGRLVRGITPFSIPPLKRGGNWHGFRNAADEEELNKYERNYGRILTAYAAGDVAKFNQEVENYRQVLEQDFPEQTGVAALEASFTHASPFFHSQHLYMLVLALGCLSWAMWPDALRRAGLYLAIFTFAVHTAAILIRMYIMGRPPVTNLYSSAIFIGWGAVATGIVLDFIYRNGIGVAAAGAVGYCTLLIARHLSLQGDTMGSLEAVLDTNFWLATHVTTITLGYTACFLAGFIGAVYILVGLFTPLMTTERTLMVNKMLYGVVCFGMFLSFVGTVLGGIWADQSWGRFWGWDPKENGALLIVLWCALILHARWGGMVKLRGMAMLAVGGNIVTAWSWFGTNMLGVGLHSYGFVPERFFWMIGFVISQLLIIALAGIPLNLWRSYYRPPAPREIDMNPEQRPTPLVAAE